MNKHKLVLLGGLPGELRISATVLHEAVGALIEGARLATRFARRCRMVVLVTG